MKKLILTLAVAVAGVAMADLNSYWLAAYTEAYTDKELSKGEMGKYEAYYCTVAAAQSMFGASTVDGVTAYLSESTANYLDGYGAITKAISDSPVASKGGSAEVGTLANAAIVKDQYEFKSTYGDPLVGSAYLAVLFYDKDGTKGFRVLENDPASIAQGGALFSDKALASDGQAGPWTAVPEPTGGLLLLLGAAGLALKRKSVA